MGSGYIQKILGEIPYVDIIDIDNYNGSHALVIGPNATGTKPAGYGGNRFLLLSDTYVNGSTRIYGVQIAIGFASNKIAVRNSPYNTSGSTWSEWRYI